MALSQHTIDSCNHDAEVETRMWQKIWDIVSPLGVAVYLTVPFTEKEQAKSCGAWWDGSTKKWYVRDAVTLMNCWGWVPQETKDLYNKREAAPKAEERPTIAVDLETWNILLAERDRFLEGLLFLKTNAWDMDANSVVTHVEHALKRGV